MNRITNWYGTLHGIHGLYNAYTSINELAGLYVIRDERTSRYAACSIDTLSEILQINGLSLHEVIISREQKMRYDIDADLDKIGKIRKKYGDIYTDKEIYDMALEDIIIAIKQTFNTYLYVDLRDEDIVICDSSDETVKFSSHIIITNYHFSKEHECEKLFKKTILNVSETYIPLLDGKIYSNNHNLRLVNSVKGNRVKRIVSDHTNLESICSYIDSEYSTLLEIKSAPKAQITSNKLPNPILESILQLANTNIPNVMCNFVLTKVNEPFIQFVRVAQSYCEFCDTHSHTNKSLFLQYSVSGEDLDIKYGCWGAKDTSKYIGTITGGAVVAGLSGAGSRGYLSVGLTDKNVATSYSSYAHYELTQTLKRVYKSGEKDLLQLNASIDNTYDETYLRDIEHDEVVMIRAGMGIGKTNGLRKHLTEYYPENEFTSHRIVMVTFRQTLARSYKQNFEEFTVYLDSRDKMISDDKLIIQFESLHRLAIFSEPPDLVVLDESESIIEQLSSGLSGEKLIENFAKFEYLIKHSKRLICMDANIGNRSFALLKYIRSASPENICAYTLHWNMCKKQVNKIYNISVDIGSWLSRMRNFLNQDKRIVIATNILTDANTIYKMLSTEFPDKQIKIYSSETSASVKSRHFEDVNCYWAMLDILIYTPTVSAGVSFTEHHFDYMFAYFSDQSCNVENCIQMLGRVRNIAEEYYICVSSSYKRKTVDREALIESITASRNSLMDNYNVYGIRVQYARDGNRYVYTSPYFYLHIENIVNNNLSQNNFLGRLTHYIKDSGGTLIPFIVENCDEAVAKFDMHSNEVMNKLIEDIVNANDIQQSEADNIQQIIRNGGENIDLPDEHQEADHENLLILLKRYNFRKSYRYNGPINEKMVRTYWPESKRRVFANLSKIYPNPSVKIPQLRQYEKTLFTEAQALNNRRYEPADIQRNYESMLHTKLFAISKLFNIDMDNRYPTDISMHEIDQNLVNYISQGDTLSNHIKQLYEELNMRLGKLPSADDDEYRHVCLEHLANLLKKYYNISYSRNNNLFKFKHSKYFALKDGDYKPNILAT